MFSIRFFFWESSDFGHPEENPTVRTMCWKKVLLFLRVLKMILTLLNGNSVTSHELLCVEPDPNKESSR